VKRFLGIKTPVGILPTLGPISVWILLFVFAPVGVIIYFSFLPADTAGEITAGVSLKNYWLLLTGDTDYGNAILRSVLYAFITNMVCLTIGYPTAYWIARYGGKFKALLLFLVIAPSWSCYLVRIYALKQLVGYTGILNDFLLHLR
jgi:spermidine/putrescine transport system permease protein